MLGEAHFSGNLLMNIDIVAVILSSIRCQVFVCYIPCVGMLQSIYVYYFMLYTHSPYFSRRSALMSSPNQYIYIVGGNIKALAQLERLPTAAAATTTTAATGVCLTHGTPT